jgi:hypothetical protein
MLNTVLYDLIEDINNAPVMVKEHRAEFGYIKEIVDKDDSTTDNGVALEEEEEIIEDDKGNEEEPDDAPVLLNDADKR